MGNILEVIDLTKIYDGGVIANYKINFQVEKGTIHAIVGENGAGKTTLMKMLYGMESITNGEMYFEGEKLELSSPKEAVEKGIGMVHQHFMLVPSFTVAENLVLGIEPTKGLFIDKKKELEDMIAISKKFNLHVDIEKKVRDIDVGMKQKLEILKALYREAKLIIFDEPTAVLTPQETEELFVQLRNLRALGYTIIFISHKLEEVKQLCDNITVIKDGRTVGTYPLEELTIEEISNLMVGRDITLSYDKEKVSFGEDILKVENLNYTDIFSVKKLNNLSFSIKEGEILGIAGIEGNGQNELTSILIGTLAPESGNVIFHGNDITSEPIIKRREEGMAYIPQDRFEEGCGSNLSVADNILSNEYKSHSSKLGILNNSRIKNRISQLVKEFEVKTPNIEQRIGALSGGNVQKCIIAREFSSNSSLIIANQPTRGVDIGSIEFIHKKILEMRLKGKSILLVSADLTELLSLSDRIIVFYKGEIVGCIEDVKGTNEKELGLYMLGIKNDFKDKEKEGYNA